MRNQLAEQYDKQNYYLLAVGITYRDRSKAYFGSNFQKNVNDILSSTIPNYSPDRILTIVKKYYSFVYIPIESKMHETLRLETFEMQQLMNKKIVDEIEKVLTQKVFSERGKSKRFNAVDYVNNALDRFMDSVNKKVIEIDPQYSFKVDTNYKKNLTAYDLREKILEAYFSIRTLKKDSKEIKELSSGEQRIALIDIATAFLNNVDGDKKGFIIFAVDEPEASMHISKCFKQFKRIEALSSQTELQILLTTHWYGSLPTIQKGNIHHISSSEKPSIRTYDLQNYLENRREFPDDIEMKSFFELVTTIISSVKHDNTNWIICEGYDDRVYLNHFLEGEIDNLHILPVGGIGNVIKLYEYLYAPYNEKKEKTYLKNGKILCLIDSDIEQKSINFSSSIDFDFKIARLQLDSNNSFSLQELKQAGTYYPTTIEDCLSPKIFFEAVSQTITNISDQEIIDLFNDFEINPSCSNSRLIGESTLLKPKSLDVIDRKPELYAEFKTAAFKSELAKRYVSLSTKKDKPEIAKEIKLFFTRKPKNI